LRDFDRAIGSDESGVARAVASVLAVGVGGDAISTTIASRVAIINIFLIYTNKTINPFTIFTI
jgi:hypothetical protein